MVSVKISAEYNYASDHLDQYDYGQILRMHGDLPSPVEVQFSLKKTGGEAPRRLGTLVDGAVEVDIPDEMLRNNDTTHDYQIYAFVYVRDETSGETTHRIVIPVKSRPKPGEYLPPDQPDFPEQLIAIVMAERENAETAREEAEAWAHGHENYPDNDEDNAKFYAEQANKSALKTGSDAETVKNDREAIENTSLHVEILAKEVSDNRKDVELLKNQAQSAAENSILSEQKAKESEQRSEEILSEVQISENTVSENLAESERVMREVLLSEEKTEENKASVEKMKEEVSTEHKNALADINLSASNAVKSISKSEEDAKTNISNLSNECTRYIENEGTRQVGSVQEEGERQVLSINEASEGIAQDATAVEIKKKMDVASKFLETIANNSGKAGSLNGFGLEIGEGDSVVITCADPETGELQGAAMFPRDSTLQKINNILGEMNTSLMILAQKKGAEI